MIKSITSNCEFKSRLSVVKNFVLRLQQEISYAFQFSLFLFRRLAALMQFSAARTIVQFVQICSTHAAVYHLARSRKTQLLRVEEKQQAKDETNDDERDAKDDETDAVDDCSGNHPFIHHLLMLVRLMTPFIVTAQSRLQQVADRSQQAFYRTDARPIGCHCCCC